MKYKYSISIDMDWATDEMIDYTLNLLAEYGVHATLFMTNKTNCDLSGHEISIHPNFTSLDFEKHILERIEEFPHSKGIRSHSLFFTERLRPLYEKYSIEYQSNAMMHRQKDIAPFYMSATTVELPFFLMDTFYIIMEKGEASFDVEEINIESNGLKIFDFHPIHIFLNTDQLSRYESIKNHYHTPKELLKARNTKKAGVKDFFIDILKVCKTHQKNYGKLIDISNEFRLTQ